MIINNGKYYLYRHIRLDTGEPFYIGVGTCDFKALKFEREFKRAFSKSKRNQYWKSIVGITNYKIEILLEVDSKENLKLKEKEFIKLYGRINNNTGILANMTEGGEGIDGKLYKPVKRSKESIERARKRMIENNPNKDGSFIPTSDPIILEKVRKRMRENNPRHLYSGESDPYKRKCYQYTTEGKFIREWLSQSEAAQFYNCSVSILHNSLGGRAGTSVGFMWRKDFLGENISAFKRKPLPTTKNIFRIDMEGNEKEFESIKEGGASVGITKTSNISSAIKTGKLSYGFYWKYKN